MGPRVVPFWDSLIGFLNRNRKKELLRGTWVFIAFSHDPKTPGGREVAIDGRGWHSSFKRRIPAYGLGFKV